MIKLKKEFNNNYFYKFIFNKPHFYNFKAITLDFADLIFFRKAASFFKNYLVENFRRTFSFGFYYLRGMVFILFIDACLTDDEPLWEPIE
jgi:hypothetical protein